MLWAIDLYSIGKGGRLLVRSPTLFTNNGVPKSDCTSRQGNTRCVVFPYCFLVDLVNEPFYEIILNPNPHTQVQIDRISLANTQALKESISWAIDPYSIDKGGKSMARLPALFCFWYPLNQSKNGAKLVYTYSLAEVKLFGCMIRVHKFLLTIKHLVR